MRRVLMLETDERPGLVAQLTAACTARGVSLDISTGPGHVLITFVADDALTAIVVAELRKVAGVSEVHPYEVAQ